MSEWNFCLSKFLNLLNEEWRILALNNLVAINFFQEPQILAGDLNKITQKQNKTKQPLNCT